MSEPRDCVPLLESRDMYAMAAWASSRPVRHGWKGRTCQDIWDKAPEPSWLLTYAMSAKVPRSLVLRAAATCARMALPHVRPDQRGFASRAIRAAERMVDEPTERRRAAAKRAAYRLEAAHRIDRSVPSWCAARAALWTALDRLPAAVRHVADLSDLVGDPSLRSRCLASIRDMVPFIELPAGARR